MNLTHTLALVLLCASFQSVSNEQISTNLVTVNPSNTSQLDQKNFQTLVDHRKQLIISQKSIESELNRLEQELSYLPQSPADIDTTIAGLKTRMATERKTLTTLDELTDRTPQQQIDLDQLKQYISADEGQIARLEEDKTRLINLNAEKEQLRQKSNDAYVELASVEQLIATRLNLEDERNAFRTWISIAFCVLVAIVIIGFYSIAMKKEAIAESIFAGEKGIQFVTIFLIVIAIILFGIMGILEGKELSALLGGLSGYILGRVSGGNQGNCPNGKGGAISSREDDGSSASKE